jgi:hypothetical protein
MDQTPSALVYVSNCQMMPSSFSQVWFTQVKKSLWNPVKSTTLEHNHFGIALEHKMLHHIRPQPTNQTSDLLTGAAL